MLYFQEMSSAEIRDTVVSQEWKILAKNLFTNNTQQ